MLVEERSIVEGIESDSVRQFDGIELGFLGEDGFDVWLEQRICGQERGAQRALQRGLGLGLVRLWQNHQMSFSAFMGMGILTLF